MQARRSLELDLRKALDRRPVQGLLPAARERADPVTDRFRGAGSVASSGTRMISPAEFIPLAEEIGLIVPLGANGSSAGLHRCGWLAGPPKSRGQSVASATRLPNADPGGRVRAGTIGTGSRKAGTRNHRNRHAGGYRRDPGHLASAFGISGWVSPWTISEPVTRHSAICGGFPSARSKSTSLSSRAWGRAETATRSSTRSPIFANNWE